MRRNGRESFFNNYGSGYVMFRTTRLDEKPEKITWIICKIYNVFVDGDEIILWKAQMTELLNYKYR
jgi:hypothetical protein